MAKEIVTKDRLLGRVSVWFFDRPLFTAFLWIVLTIFGSLSYGLFMRREGFPTINFPLAVIGGTYITADPAEVDAKVAGPITDIALEQVEEISTISTNTVGNFFTIRIYYESDVNSREATAKIEEAVKSSGRIPAEALVQYNVPFYGATGGDVYELDMAVSFYDKTDKLTTEQLVSKAELFAQKLGERSVSDVREVFVKPQFAQLPNPMTGQLVSVQRNYDRFGLRENGKTSYHNSVIVGVAAVDDYDVIKVDGDIRKAIEEVVSYPEFSGLGAEVSASEAPGINENISELQRSLLEGLVAILIVGSIVIAWRASLITVLAMVTVVAITLGFMYSIGYTLNVITMFSLIVALALIVDDTIIMVEAIDAARHNSNNRRKVVQEATRKISRAMVAATLTASLSFAPLLFVTGILGNFIRVVPITVITALLTSLLVALFFIPLFSRVLLLGKKHLGKKSSGDEVSAGIEAKIAEFITRPMIWARGSRTKLFEVGAIAVLIGFGFIGGSLLIARNVEFNIFPPTKDTNGLTLSVDFAPDTTLDQAQRITDKIDQVVSDESGDNFVQASYFGNASQQGVVQAQVEITHYSDREISSRELIKNVQNRLDSEVSQARIVVGQLDISPPQENLVVQINAQDRQAALKAAEDLRAWLETAELKRSTGTAAHFVEPTVSGASQYARAGGKPVVTVSTGFDGQDTSALTGLAVTAINDEFNGEKLKSYGLPEDALFVELGFEANNQESFQSLVLAFPVLLVVIYILLAIQFRSLLQPLLIFMAIPFSLFGITLGLDLTNNAFSFFAMLGFFALLGLSIKNTILLTDYANQARSQGLSVVDSAVEALRERFRPLFATSATAVVSLIPLAITSPFWEALMVVLIFGLISSTFLVVTVFPYYYLGAEFMRLNINKRVFLIWFVATVAVAGLVGWKYSYVWGLMVTPISLVAGALHGFWARSK